MVSSLAIPLPSVAAYGAIFVLLESTGESVIPENLITVVT